ncbi:hypothetical protein M3Y97_00071300 [Aphelenchoides bicaudatus]|nr:hypothetical protein M3Y97_00071300 [Aphelenchoides bicaudatus]
MASNIGPDTKVLETPQNLTNILPNADSGNYYFNDLFSATMALLNPDDFWLLRLTLILLGYASVLIPNYFLVQFVKRKWQENEAYFRQNAFLNFVRQFAIGQPEFQREYAMLPTDANTASREDKTEDRSTSNSFARKCVMLAIYSAGIQITLVSMGFFQERIMTLGYARLDSPSVREKFGDAQFLVFANRMIALALVGSYLFVKWRKMPPHVPPLYTHSFVSISNTLSSWCQYEALKFVSFPTQTVNERRPTSDYIMGICLALGAGLFFFSSQVASQTSDTKYEIYFGGAVSGIVLMAGYLFFDAFTLNWQKKLFDTKPKISRYQMMLGVNGFSAILCLVSLLEQGTLFTSTNFLLTHTGFALDVFLLSFSNATGQLFIYVTIEQFGPVVFAVIMTVRQIFSIILSTIYFSHPINFVGVLGLGIAFGALIINNFKFYWSRNSKVEQKQ